MSSKTHSFTEAELESALRLRDKKVQEGPPDVDSVWLFIGQLGYYYGWGAVEALNNKKLRLENARMLVAAAEVVEAKRTVDTANAMRAALSSVHTKNKGSFNALLRPYLELISRSTQED